MTGFNRSSNNCTRAFTQQNALSIKVPSLKKNDVNKH